MASVKAMFFLPNEDNDGRSLEEEIRELEMELTFTFAGWTCAGYVAGHYRMADGTGASDVNSSYFVVLDESRIDVLAEILKNFMDGTTQEAIYLEIHRNVEF
ncbi:MAG: hypothetical protein EXS16_09005 [Gemmataceae bacterium]|nr:hypothetical protein [Gemmataceae bacterium]